MHYQYQVAGIAVGFRLPFRLTITEESQAFLRELGEPASGFQVHFLPVPALDPPEPDGHWEVCQYHMETASERRVYHCPTPQAPPYACMIWQKIPGNQAQCQYLAGKEEYLAYSRNICDLIGLEALLHQNQGLLLHASFIRGHDLKPAPSPFFAGAASMPPTRGHDLKRSSPSYTVRAK